MEKMLQNLGYDYEFIKYSRNPTLDLILRSIDRIPEKVRSKIVTINKKKSLKIIQKLHRKSNIEINVLIFL